MTPEPAAQAKQVLCSTCTARLVRLCYDRAWWFRLFRGPMVFGMRAMARWHRIDPREHEVRTAACYGCVRFMKNALKERSAAFRWLNDRINPFFNRVRNGLLTEAEIQEAKAFAGKAMERENPPP